MRLNREQLKLANSDTMGHFVIRGIAGSGKTSVGMKRIKYLLKKYVGQDNKVLVVSYNKALSMYMDYIYKNMEEERNISLFDGQEEQTKENVQIKTIDSIMAFYFYKYCREENIKLEIEWEASHQVMNAALNKLRERYPKENILQTDNIKFLREEMKWIKGCGYLALETYQQADRIGRGGSKNEGPTRLGKNSTNRQIIYELMEQMDKILQEEEKVDGGMASILALHYMQNHPRIGTYHHIVIDEAQDLTKVQLEFINQLKDEGEQSSILFLMDAAQSIYPQAWLGKGNPFTTIGYDMKGKGAKLSKNYRTTTQISLCAYSLLSKEKNIIEDSNFVKPSLFEKHGEYPIYRNFLTNKDQNNYIVKIIKGLIKEGYAPKEIAVVSKINKNLELLQDVLHAQNIESLVFRNNRENAFKQDKVQLLTMHSVKGLEFEIVILMDLNDGVIPYIQEGWQEEERLEEEITERKLLYVGMTRAKKKLFMCSYGEESKFVKDIDTRYLAMQSGCKMGVYYHVPYEHYIGRGQIKDELGEEESIRQWVMQELIQNYGYPKELLVLEYKVRNFSAEGKVDIAILNGKNNEPYIFIEVKKKGIPIQEAINQLKSYMNVSKVDYGVATNGTHIAFLDRSFNVIRDIPVCHLGILPSAIECFEWVNKELHQTYYLEHDTSACEILVENAIVPKEELISLKIYADIAAGVPIEIVDETKGHFLFPREWIGHKKDLFMLQVRGDSMVGAGIDSGDLVVLRATQEAREHRILAVEYNGGATLKKYVRMGDTVLLMSENPEYEPIQITEGEVSVLGELLGVVKKKITVIS